MKKVKHTLNRLILQAGPCTRYSTASKHQARHALSSILALHHQQQQNKSNVIAYPAYRPDAPFIDAVVQFKLASSNILLKKMSRKRLIICASASPHMDDIALDSCSSNGMQHIIYSSFAAALERGHASLLSLLTTVLEDLLYSCDKAAGIVPKAHSEKTSLWDIPRLALSRKTKTLHHMDREAFTKHDFCDVTLAHLSNMYIKQVKQLHDIVEGQAMTDIPDEHLESKLGLAVENASKSVETLEDHLARLQSDMDGVFEVLVDTSMVMLGVLGAVY
ncbi:hypothetical protein L7F22_025128 [Adiantum nelumboides]|nr:hypothetical protein [Adiantum nelumboides]